MDIKMNLGEGYGMPPAPPLRDTDWIQLYLVIQLMMMWASPGCGTRRQSIKPTRSTCPHGAPRWFLDWDFRSGRAGVAMAGSSERGEVVVVAALDLEINGWWWSREGRRRWGRICARFCSPAWDDRTDLSENEILFRWGINSRAFVFSHYP
jgi:hypothetical protein